MTEILGMKMFYLNTLKVFVVAWLVWFSSSLFNSTHVIALYPLLLECE